MHARQANACTDGIAENNAVNGNPAYSTYIRAEHGLSMNPGSWLYMRTTTETGASNGVCPHLFAIYSAPNTVQKAGWFKKYCFMPVAVTSEKEGRHPPITESTVLLNVTHSDLCHKARKRRQSGNR